MRNDVIFLSVASSRKSSSPVVATNPPCGVPTVCISLLFNASPLLYYRSPSSVFPFMTEENNKSVQSFPCENHAISIQQCDMLMGSIIDVWIRSSQTVVVFNTENTNVENAQQSDP